MKKLLLLTLTALMMVGCDGTQRNTDGSIVLDTYWKEHSIENPYIEVVDSCEYIVNEEKYAFAYTESAYKTYTHKGNCKYCEYRDSIKWEKRKREIKNILQWEN